VIRAGAMGLWIRLARSPSDAEAAFSQYRLMMRMPYARPAAISSTGAKVATA
jgi:hypothetical protein